MTTKDRGLIRGAFVALASALLAVSGSAQEVVSGPNGKIAFDRDGPNGTRNIWAMNADGSGQKQLTRNSGYNYIARWSPDGAKIAFTRASSSGTHSEIYVMNADGTGVTQLTSDATNGSAAPAWSPDGTKIAFARAKDGVGFYSDIYVMDANGANLTNLTPPDANNTSTVDNRSPAWSPDGAQIAFESTRTGFDNIYVMPATGSATPTNLTNEPFQDRLPAWSPDGTKIAFDSFRNGTEEILVMNADGTGQTTLTTTAFDLSAAWSPDGAKIAFASNASGQFDIWSMNPDGTGPVNLSNSARHDDLRPDWPVAVPCKKPHCP